MGLQKIVGNLIDKLRELHMNGHLEICSRPQVIDNLPNILQKSRSGEFGWKPSLLIIIIIITIIMIIIIK